LDFLDFFRNCYYPLCFAFLKKPDLVSWKFVLVLKYGLFPFITGVIGYFNNLSQQI